MKKSANGARTSVHRLACAVWVGVGVVAPWADVADGRSVPVRSVLLVLGWSAWTATLIALLVPASVSLTVVSTVAPVAFAAALADGRPVSLLVASAAFVLFMLPDTADTLVQGGAYGAETRFLLRTPLPYLLPAILVTAALVSTVVAGPLLLAARNWVLGIPVSAAAGLLAWRAPRRLHRLSRRWLVLVPAGVVVHDHMVLAETVMLRRTDISLVAPRNENGDAADLTGGVLGRRILIGMNEAEKVLLTPITSKVLGTGEALHVQSFTVSPRRTEAALERLVSPRG